MTESYKFILKNFISNIIIFLRITSIVIFFSGCNIFSEPPLEIPSIVFDINVISPTTIELSWDEYYIEVEKFIITKEHQDSLIASYVFSNEQNSFIDDCLIPGTTYNYKIFVNNYDYSYGSHYINTLQPPSDLKVIVDNGEAIKLTWQDNNQIEDLYYIERKEENENFFTIIDSLPTNSTYYLDNSLEHKKRYSYRINSRIEDYYTNYTNTDSTGFHFKGLFVPTDYPTIIKALYAASPAEKVILEPGRYDGGILFPEKNITLCSRFVLDKDASYIKNTIIDGKNQDIVGIEFPSISSYYHPQGKLQGLTIQNCSNGALRCLDHTHPSLIHLVIKNNVTNHNGAINFSNCTNGEISNLLIYDNSSNVNVGVINLYNASISIHNCTIVNNDITAINCSYYSRLTIKNSIVYNNIGNAIYLDERCVGCTVFYCDIEGGENNIQNLCSVDTWWYNSINENPLFVDIGNLNFHLSPESPCIDSGEDLDIYLDADGTRNDMGAYGGPNSDW